MSILKTNSNILLEASDRFLKAAQTMQYSQDGMSKAINATLGQSLSAIAGKYLSTRGVSSIEVHINYNPPNANFVIMSTGSESDAVSQEMAAELNQKFGQKISKIMGQYQKDKPLDYKVTSFE